jgi:putative endonuclease
MGRQYYVYLLANTKHGSHYVGVTNDLVRRVYEHKEKLVPGFTKRHGVSKLGHYEVFHDPALAKREATEEVAPRMKDTDHRA